MPTHSYTVCEQQYMDHQTDGMPREDSRMSGRVGCGTGGHYFMHDPLEEELDPCLSAAVRYKSTKGIGKMRVRYLLFCIIVLLAIALIAVAYFMIFGYGTITSPRIQTQHDHPTVPSMANTSVDASSSVPSTAKTVSTSKPTTKAPPPPRKVVTRPPPQKPKPRPPVITLPPPAPPRKVTTTTTTKATTTTTTKQIVIPQPARIPVQDCQHYYKLGQQSGTKRLSVPNHGEFYAYCQMEAGHGWVVLQRRTGNNLPFWNATFEEYAVGFGDPDGDHWLGLERVRAFVEHHHTLEMRIRLQGDFCASKQCSGLGESGSWWGDWEFTIESRADNYRIKELKYLRGNLTDPKSNQPEKELFSHLCEGEQFTTVDADNDKNKEHNCARISHRGAWWHRDCAYTTPNGRYGDVSKRPNGMFWLWKSSTENITHISYIIKPMKSLILFRVAN